MKKEKKSKTTKSTKGREKRFSQIRKDAKKKGIFLM